MLEGGQMWLRIGEPFCCCHFASTAGIDWIAFTVRDDDDLARAGIPLEAAVQSVAAAAALRSGCSTLAVCVLPARAFVWHMRPCARCSCTGAEERSGGGLGEFGPALAAAKVTVGPPGGLCKSWPEGRSGRAWADGEATAAIPASAGSSRSFVK